MDIYSLIKDNASAVIGFIGVIVGAILTSIPVIFLQILQRRWDIQDKNKQWRRERLLHRLSIIQEWLDETIKFTRTFATYIDDENENTEFLNNLESELKQYFGKYPQNDSVVFFHDISTGDDELIGLLKGYGKLRDIVFDSLIKNEKEKSSINIVLLDGIASKTARRIKFLIEEASPIGGNYHDRKKLFNIFRKKPK